MLGVALADLLGGAQPLVRLRRRHPDVDHGHVRLVHGDVTEQVVGVAGLRDDVEAGVVEQPRDALAQQHGVVGEDDADRASRRGAREAREVAAEARLVELEDPLRLRQLRQRPEAEVAELAVGREHERSRLGRDDLAAVAGVGDPEGAVDLDADVAVLAERGGAGVQPDADAHRRRPGVARDPPLCVDRGLRRRSRRRRRRRRARRRASRPRALRRRDGFAQQPPEVGEHGLPALTELACEPRRALDVGEEEGDGSGRKRAHPGECRSRERARPVGHYAASVQQSRGCGGRRRRRGGRRRRGRGRARRELEGRVAREVEHLDGDAVVLGRPPEDDVDAVAAAVGQIDSVIGEHDFLLGGCVHGATLPRTRSPRRCGAQVVCRCGFPYPSGSGSSGISAVMRVPPVGGLSTVERALERLDAVGEAAQARSAWLDRRRRRRRRRPRRRALVSSRADPHVDDRGARVLDHVRECLGDHVVRGGLDGARQLDLRRLDLDRDRQARGERLERRGEAAVGEDGRDGCPRASSRSSSSAAASSSRARLEHRLGRRRVGCRPSTGRAAARARARRAAAGRRRGGFARAAAAPRRRP